MKRLFLSTFLFLSVLVFATGCATTNTADNSGSDDATIGTAVSSAEDTTADGTAVGVDPSRSGIDGWRPRDDQ